MYFDVETHRELMRTQISEERERIELRLMARTPTKSAALRARLSRLLVRAAFAIDSDEGWRAFWSRLSRSGTAARNPDI